MNICDIMVILICFLFAVFGWRLGAVFMILFLAAGFVGSWFASNYYTLASDFFEPHPQAMVYGYLCVFMGVLFIMIGAGFVIHTFFAALRLNFILRIIGLTGGIALGVLINMSIILPLSALNNKTIQSMIKKSFVTRHMLTYTEKMVALYPAGKKKLLHIKIPASLQKLQNRIKSIPQKFKPKKKK